MIWVRSRNLQTVLIAVVSAAVTASVMTAVPAISAVFDAENAHKVDGKHAVSCDATTAKRKGKLIATCATNGRLPNNIISKAPNSAKLNGNPASAFDRAGRFHNSGLEGIDASNPSTSETLLTVGPISYIGKCTDEGGGTFRLDFQFSSSETFTVAATQFGVSRVESGQENTAKNLVFASHTSIFAFSDHFRVATPSGIDHQVSVFYGVHSLGEDCVAGVRVEEAI
jgi:hypothetical protein